LFGSVHFLFFVTFGNEVTKILHNLCLHFARQDGQDGKKRKENHATKVTKKPKNQRTKIWDEKFICKTNNSFLLQNVFENGPN
jgi:hypothetical protein